LQQYLFFDSHQAVSVGDAILFVFILILSLVLVIAWVGLWLLKHWARVVYTTAIVLGVVATFFVGPVVSPALAAAFSGVSDLAGGIILGIIWFSELRSRFEVHRI